MCQIRGESTEWAWLQFVHSEQDTQADCTDKKDQSTNILNKFIYK